MRYYKDYRKGQPLEASWVQQVNKELQRLSRITGAGGISVSRSATGVVIRGNETPVEPSIIAKAAVEEGTYPTVQSWSEATLTTQRKVWEFQLGTPTYDEDDASSQTSFTATPNSYVKAQNLTGHYIPQGMLCKLDSISGKYYVDYTMPLYVTGTTDAQLSASSNVLVTLASGQHITGKIRAYDRYLGSGQTITSGKVVGCSLRSYFDSNSGRYYWRYDVTEVVC